MMSSACHNYHARNMLNPLFGFTMTEHHGKQDIQVWRAVWFKAKGGKHPLSLSPQRSGEFGCELTQSNESGKTSWSAK